MTKWSEQQKQRAHEKKQLERMQRHQMRVEVLKIMQTDPEMKYYIGMATGSFAGAVGFLTGDSMPPPTDTTSTEAWYSWLLPPGGGIFDVFGGDTETNIGSVGMFGILPDVLKIGGTGFAGMCAMILILKAIFGDEDVASLMQGMGTAVDAVVPL